MDSLDLFPGSYEEAREWFIGDLEKIRAGWRVTNQEKYALGNFPDLSIDWIWAEPERKQKLFILTTGEHGIEGFAGTAIMRLFIESFLPNMNSQDSGLLLVHAMNPWGMRHFRKVNQNNVDLNRNFVPDGIFDENLNPEFKILKNLLTPARRVPAFPVAKALFGLQVIRALVMQGASRVSTAALLGQHHSPSGFFYGGRTHEENTRVMMGLYRRALKEYENVVHIDIHTGYGPRNGMSIIIPPSEPITSAEAAAKFNYPLVQKINAEEFYAIHGDMQDWFYQLQRMEFPARSLFACGFEFGTFGDSLPARLRSLRAMVLENQLYWHGAADRGTSRAIRREFRGLYFPESRTWRRQVVSAGKQALEGVLGAQKLMREKIQVN